jgi:hypothetical protein
MGIKPVVIQIRRSTQEASILAPCRIACSQLCGRGDKADFADPALGTAVLKLARYTAT